MFKRRTATTGRRVGFSTDRPDWDAVITQLYSRVVEGAPYALGVVARQKGLLGLSLRPRLNKNAGNQAAVDYIRGRFRDAEFDRVFQADEGLAQDDQSGLFKVTGEGLGLPRNSLIARVESSADEELKAVVIFGGERLEGQLQRRLQVLAEVLGQGPGSGGSQVVGAPLGPEEREKLLAALADLNVRRLSDYDPDLLARIINGLEEGREALPKELKPKYKAAGDYLLRKRLKS
jgi:hypothetical protein